MKFVQGLKKGINLGGWLSQCVHTKAHYDSFILEEDIQKISAWGLDHVRVPIDCEAIETNDGEFKEDGFGYIDACIAWCKKYGLRMILDIHKTAGYTFNNAFGEENSLFNSEELQKRFINLWDEIAQRYGKEKDTVVFELLNEIVEDEYSEPWNILSKKTIEVIRKHAPETQIIIGGVEWNSAYAVTLLDEPYDENIIYTFHFYEPFAFTHQNAGWVPEIKGFHIEYPSTVQAYKDAAETIGEKAAFIFRTDVTDIGVPMLEQLVLKAIDFAEARGVALYCGEYGVIDQAPTEGTLRWYQDIHQLFEKHHIGRAAWSYKEMDFGIVDAHYKPVFDGILASL
ncbi:MAG: cellulase family glycosylhydrolase [Eubacteriales bacterium]